MTTPELLKQIAQVDACMRECEPEDVAAWENIKAFANAAATAAEPMRDEHGDIVLFVRREPDGRVTDILWTISQEERERHTLKALKALLLEARELLDGAAEPDAGKPGYLGAQWDVDALALIAKIDAAKNRT